MKKILLSKRMLTGFILSALAFATLSAANWFVKANASGTGTSWDDPCNISVLGGTPAGIADGDVVYVAAGSYSRSTTITIAKYVTVMGGYPAASTGTDVSSRNLSVDSVLIVPASGNTTARGLSISASTAAGVNKIVLDGFTFEGFSLASGNAGAAVNISNSQGDIQFKNCNFISNATINTNGGAVYMGAVTYNIALSFENCLFKSNQSNVAPTIANGYGGAAYFNNGTTNKTINFTSCTFKSNKAYNRAAAVYFTQSLTSTFTDCTFDSNQLTNATDAQSSGGCFYIAGGGSAAVILNTTRCVFLNSYSTNYGSVLYFNTTPKNTFNMTDCSLMANYSSRTTSARAAIDCSSYATTLGGSISGSVLSNYNWSGSAKASNKADLMYLTGASTDVNLTFSNSILNGTYFSNSNVSAAVSPSLLYTTTGFLKDSTIALALSGDLKITDKIVLNKTFVGLPNLGSYIHSQIFDVKRNTGKAMTLNATIPYGYKITVDGVDYQFAGLNVIQIPASQSDPVITISSVVVTGTNPAKESNLSVRIQNDNVIISGVQVGTNVSLYNAAGQRISNQVLKSDNLILTNLHSGVYVLIIGNERFRFVK